MRRQDQWIDLADRLGQSRVAVVAVCAFLNMQRADHWIAGNLQLPLDRVRLIAQAAKPLLRRSRRQTRNNSECAYCGATRDLQRDHVMPRSRGGTDDPENLVWACRSCNSAKGNRTPEEWLG